MPHALTNLSLRTLLAIDAATCALMGAVLLVLAQQLGALLNIPAQLLFWAGAILLPTAAFMAVAAAAMHRRRFVVGVIVSGNVLWALASVALPAFGVISPNAWGWAFLAAQAAAVAVLTKLEFDAASCFTRAPSVAPRAA